MSMSVGSTMVSSKKLEDVQHEMALAILDKLQDLIRSFRREHRQTRSEIQEHAGTLLSQKVHANKYRYKRRLIEVGLIELRGVGERKKRELPPPDTSLLRCTR